MGLVNMKKILLLFIAGLFCDCHCYAQKNGKALVDSLVAEITADER